MNVTKEGKEEKYMVHVPNITFNLNKDVEQVCIMALMV
jgi:hypothetical protein